MKLIRFGQPGQEKPGVLQEDETMIDVSAFGDDYDAQFFATDGTGRLARWLEEHQSDCATVDKDTRLGPPVKNPSKLVCVGLNYTQHAIESGMEPPSEPVLFFKAPSAIIGPNDDIIIPKNSTKTDWEVELAIVIGKRAKYVDEAKAMEYVAGYVLFNDVSERDFQLERGGQWVKGKSADTFAPVGPFIATSDEIPDPHNLNLWLKVNDKVMQSSNTSDMVFGISTLVSYISHFMTLLPGDIVSTGTPFGVGMGLKPQKYLRPGDVVELGIDGLGTAKQHVRANQDK